MERGRAEPRLRGETTGIATEGEVGCSAGLEEAAAEAAAAAAATAEGDINEDGDDTEAAGVAEEVPAVA